MKIVFPKLLEKATTLLENNSQGSNSAANTDQQQALVLFHEERQNLKGPIAMSGNHGEGREIAQKIYKLKTTDNYEDEEDDEEDDGFTSNAVIEFIPFICTDLTLN